jgi:hypothetical protein
MNQSSLLMEFSQRNVLIVNMGTTFEMYDLFSILGLAHVYCLFKLGFLRMIVTNFVSQIHLKNALSNLAMVFPKYRSLIRIKICHEN